MVLHSQGPETAPPPHNPIWSLMVVQGVGAGLMRIIYSCVDCNVLLQQVRSNHRPQNWIAGGRPPHFGCTSLLTTDYWVNTSPRPQFPPHRLPFCSFIMPSSPPLLPGSCSVIPPFSSRSVFPMIPEPRKATATTSKFVAPSAKSNH